MPRIFKNLTRKLAGERNSQNYFIYALGEVLLVMVGILLAVSVNNWSTHQKSLRTEQSILKGLEKLCLHNLENLNIAIDKNYAAFQATNLLLSQIQPTTHSLDDQEIDSLLSDMMFWMTSFDPSSGVVEDLLYSGKLDIIRSDSLRINLSNWTGVFKDTDEDVQITFKHYEEALVPYLTQQLNFSNLDDHLKNRILQTRILPIVEASSFQRSYEFMNSAEFENIVYVHSLNLSFTLFEYDRVKSYLLETLDLIKDGIRRPIN